MSRSYKDAMKGNELQEVVVFTATQLKKIAFNVLKDDQRMPFVHPIAWISGVR